MNIEEIDKWLDNEYGTSYTRLEELHDYFFEKYTDQKEEIERLNDIINKLEEHLIEVDKKYNKCSCYNDILQELYKLKNYKYLKDSDKE